MASMKFACESCRAQYMISDEKVGPNGVIVRCKKCKSKIVVKRPEAEAQQADSDPVTTVVSVPQMGRPAGSELPVAPPASAFDDELGRAFESVLAKKDEESQSPQEGSAPSSAPTVHGVATTSSVPALASSEPVKDDETMVVNLSAMAAQLRIETRQQQLEAANAVPSPEASEEKSRERHNGTHAPSSAGDWFVAINDKQVGPLTMEGVHQKWDAGELSADSLCWKPGMPDWKPLSAVNELAETLAPRPAPEKEAPAGAVATGVQAPAPTPLPPQQGEPGEPEWKPSAASALESLVKDELEALQKPATPPPSEAAPAEAKPRGLIDDLPDVPDSKTDNERVHVPVERPLAPSPSEVSAVFSARERAPARSAEPPESLSKNRASYPVLAPKSRMGPYLVIGIPVTLLAVAVAVVAVVLATRQPQAVIPPPSPSVGASAGLGASAGPEARVVPPPPASPQVAVAPSMPAPTPKVERKVVEPESPPAPVASEVGKASEIKERAEARSERGIERPIESTRPPTERRRHHDREVSEAATPPPTPAPTPAPEPKPAAEPPPVASLNKSKVDDDFDRMFAKTTDDAHKASDPASKAVAKKTSSVPIPPPVGTGTSKALLEQSDIMEVVLSQKENIRKCTDEAKAKEPGSSGTITMAWSIRRDGTTANIQTVTADFQKTTLAACLTGVIRTFRFPQYSGPQMDTIRFPFKF